MAATRVEELPACPMCGDPDVRLVWRGYPGYIEPDTFDIAECPACRARLALPLDVDTRRVYEAIYRQADRIPGYERYFRYAAEIEQTADPLAYLASREPAYWGISKALPRTPAGPSGNVLEVGSGLGYLTYALRRAGHDATGIDISAEAVARARARFGPHYETASIADHARRFPAQADCVVLTEVIEHLAEPLPFLRACLDAARPGGAVIVTTPNRDCYAAHVTWAVDSPPVHLLWLTRDSLAAAARRLDASLDMIDLGLFPGAHTWRLRSPRVGTVRPPMLDRDGTPRPGRASGGKAGRVIRSVRKEAVSRLASLISGGRATGGPSPTLCAVLRRPV